uniref:EF-hand domain-containing protein n=1 Tax=Globisporangium ultimum (strain ATCC 200006 / CBS 805.95 / DAOM BR144) TaxID=431595 RepID=K3WL67_GLOUD
MGQWASQQHAAAHCDLSDEQVEEIRMLTSLPVKEIARIRSKYRAVAQHEDMSKAEFYALPAVAGNPLRDRLFQMLELSSENAIPFTEFTKLVSTFSFHSSQDTKLRAAFRVHDFDGDGKLSKDDLRAYMALVYQKPVDDDTDQASTDAARQEVVELVVSRIMEEAASDPKRETLAFEDFVKVHMHL